MRLKLNQKEHVCQICEKAVEYEVHLLVAFKFYEANRKPICDLYKEMRPQFKYYFHHDNPFTDIPCVKIL